ncbi:hypothetical protein EV121DRAFT_274518 [Schizophyllum commune]
MNTAFRGARVDIRHLPSTAAQRIAWLAFLGRCRERVRDGICVAEREGPVRWREPRSAAVSAFAESAGSSATLAGARATARACARVWRHGERSVGKATPARVGAVDGGQSGGRRVGRVGGRGGQHVGHSLVNSGICCNTVPYNNRTSDLPPRAAAVSSARCPDGAHACNPARRVTSSAIAVGDEVRDASRYVGHERWRVSLLQGRSAGFACGNNDDIGRGGTPRGQEEAGMSPSRQLRQLDGRGSLASGLPSCEVAMARRWCAGTHARFRVPTMTGGHLSSPANPLGVVPCFAAVVGRDGRIAEHGGHCAEREPDASTPPLVPSCPGRRVVSCLEDHERRSVSHPW